MQEENLCSARKKKENVGGRKRTWRGGGGAAGGASLLVTLRWRPVAVSQLTDGGSRRCCGCSNGDERETSSPSPLFLSFSVVLSVPSSSSVCFFLLLFFVCSFSHVRSLSSLTSVSPLFGYFLPFLFDLLSIYRKKKELVLLLVRLGSGFRGRLVGHWARQQGAAPLILAGRAAGGRPVTSVSVVPRRGASDHSVVSRLSKGKLV